MTGLGIALAVLLFIGGVIATAGLIASKLPSMKSVLQGLMPLQGPVGIALLALGIAYLFDIGVGQIATILRTNGFTGMVHVSMTVSAVLLGFYFSMLLVASLIPGRTLSENRAVALADKLGMYGLLLGILAALTAALYFLQLTGLLAKLMEL